MTALAADRNTAERDGKTFVYPMAASKEIFAGALVFLDTSGNAEPATEATGKICAGRAEEYKNNTGAAAAETIKVKAGCFRWVNGETITKAHIGDQAYANDDQTVYRTSTGRSPVGVIVDVDSEGVWVMTHAPLLAGSTGLLAANNLSDVGTLATAQSNLGLTDGTIDARFNSVASDGDVTVNTDKVVVTASSGNIASKGTIAGRQKFQAIAANAYTVDGDDDGDIYIVSAADNDVVTLPDAAATNKGCRVTVQNGGADGAHKVSISPHSSDKIFGGIHGAAGGDLVSFGEVADKDIINTKATAKKGDYAVLISDGATGWWVVGGKGVWASEG